MLRSDQHVTAKKFGFDRRISHLRPLPMHQPSIAQAAGVVPSSVIPAMVPLVFHWSNLPAVVRFFGGGSHVLPLVVVVVGGCPSGSPGGSSRVPMRQAAAFLERQEAAQKAAELLSQREAARVGTAGVASRGEPWDATWAMVVVVVGGGWVVGCWWVGSG